MSGTIYRAARATYSDAVVRVSRPLLSTSSTISNSRSVGRRNWPAAGGAAHRCIFDGSSTHSHSTIASRNHVRCMVAHQLQPIQHQSLERPRFFSSRRRKGDTKKTPPILANERMIKQLMKKFPNAQGPTEIEVRLVIDEGPDEPATVQVCSLADAIDVSLDRMADLIATALESDPPVIRIAQLSKLEYQKEQAASKQKSASKSKQKKTFRFRAGIDLHDLERKMKDMTTFLEEGLECEYTVFSKARTLRANSNAGMDLVERIQTLVADCAILHRGPTKNEQGNHIRVQLRPRKDA